ncbi:MAG TPA: hypothetical protein PK431_13945 [Chitinophagales bacterium]|nr:hypothetical protein [Chitinophagales bacterium]
MSNCLNCGKEIAQKNGGKERKFCDNNNACKQAYHNKNKKPPKYVLKETYDKLLAKIAENNTPINKAKILSERETVNEASKKAGYPLTENQAAQYKPEKQKGETGMDYAIRLAEWKEKQKYGK